MSLAVHTNDARAFHYALLASIVLHALLLQIFAQPREAWRPVEPAPLIARLVDPPAPPSPPVVEEQPSPAPKKPAPTARRRPAPIAKPAPALPAPEAEQPAAQSPVVQPLAQQGPAQKEPELAQKAPEENKQATIPPSPIVQPEPVREFDPKVLATYRLEIIQLARQFKRYPPLARENNWEGRAEVRLRFAPGGKRPSIDLLKSSGYPILDRQAIDTMSKAVVPVPESLRGRQFALDVPVIFNLDD